MKKFDHVLLVLLGTSITHRASAEATSDLPWYIELTSAHFPHFYVKDLANDSFLKSIEETQADYVLVDFYAPWCPHCQHFAPEYERFALAISDWNKKSEGEGPGIVCAEVDCVRSPGLCEQYGIRSYPSLLWAKAADWLQSDAKPETVQLLNHTAESAAEWISNKLGVMISPPQMSRQDMAKLWRPQAGTSQPTASTTRADIWDAQAAAALLLHETFARHPFQMTGPKQVLMDFLQLLSRRFPESRATKDTPCRDSLGSLHQMLLANWSSFDRQISLIQGSETREFQIIEPDKVEKQWKLCNTAWNDYKGFGACRGSVPGKRGYTCGLWTMFHMLIARADDTSARRDTEVLRSMIEHFFDCEECRQHFLAIDFQVHDAGDRRAAQLWWWRAHNVVNSRVGKLEEQFQDGDPAFPKMPWPSEELCSNCRKSATHFIRGSKRERGLNSLDFDTTTSGEWIADNVADFLDHFYGP